MPDNHEHCDRSSECNKELEEDIPVSISVDFEVESKPEDAHENSCYHHTYEAYDVDNCDTGVSDKESENESN